MNFLITSNGWGVSFSSYLDHMLMFFIVLIDIRWPHVDFVMKERTRQAWCVSATFFCYLVGNRNQQLIVARLCGEQPIHVSSNTFCLHFGNETCFIMFLIWEQWKSLVALFAFIDSLLNNANQFFCALLRTLNAIIEFLYAAIFFINFSVYFDCSFYLSKSVGNGKSRACG